MGHTQEIGLRIDGVEMLRYLFDNEVTNTSTIEVAHIAMTIVALCFQGKEKRFLRETKTTAVCKQPTDITLTMTIATGTYQGCYFFYTVFHTAKLGYFFCNTATFNIVLSMSARYSSESGLKGR